ncbi:MAG: SDR family oxidoreductase [Pseudomonadota bacterium]
MARVLVTGGNRGIGLELCRHYAARGDDVTAVCRTASPELSALNARVIDGIDVATADGVESLRGALDEASIDVLINNAGILLRDDLDNLDFDDVMEQLRVNSVGPLRVTRALLDVLAAHAKVAIITSRMGSIDDNTSGGYYGYRMSKTAVNMAGVSLAKDLEPHGIAVVLLHPGMVATDMTGRRGVDVAHSAQGLVQRIDDTTLATSGTFWHAEGDRLPW